MTFASVSLNLTTSGVSDGFGSDVSWMLVRSYVSSISGTGAYVDVLMSIEVNA